MAARRVCGFVHGRITLLPSGGKYRVFLNCKETKESDTVVIFNPPYMTISEDSPEAFDSAFKAALSMSAFDGKLFEGQLSYDDELADYLIRRVR